MQQKAVVLVTITSLIAIAVLFSSQADDSDTAALQPAKGDRCPVCGMLVAPYPQWIARITFADGSTEFFDGAKDLFKYLTNRDKFIPEKRQAEIDAVVATSYYSTEAIPARSAFFVVGSDVYGPMGAELVAFSTRSEAEEFLKDHGGTRIVQFADVTAALLKGLG